MTLRLEPGAADAIVVFLALGLAVIVLFRRHLMPAYRIGTRALRAEARHAFKRGIPTSDEIVNAAAVEWAQQRIAVYGYLALFSMTGTIVEVATNAPGSPIFSILLTILFMSITARLVSKRRSYSSCADLVSQHKANQSVDEREL
jgi:hypothetical protein